MASKILPKTFPLSDTKTEAPSTSKSATEKSEDLLDKKKHTNPSITSGTSSPFAPQPSPLVFKAKSSA